MSRATPYEKIADAAQVNKLTGLAPSVALHIPWDRVDDYVDARDPCRTTTGVSARHDQLEHLPGRRLQAGLRSPIADPRIRQKAIDHHFDLHRRHERDRVARPQDLAGGRHQLPRAG